MQIQHADLPQKEHMSQLYNQSSNSHLLIDDNLSMSPVKGGPDN